MMRALLVDDDRMMVRTLGDVLRIKGWDVTPAYSGESAVEAAASETFDVVLMDIKMPGIDGVTAFKAMKATQPKLRVVLMTAYAAHEQIAEAEREGVVQVMQKPVDVSRLMAVITEVLSREKPVLLIDHDASFLKTLSGVLRLHGFDVVMATSLEDAQMALARHRPAAVLLHLHLGAIAPRDAVATVHEANPAAALILYSGIGGSENEVEQTVPPQWIHAYLQKPFDVDQVTSMLDAIRARG